MKYVIVKDEMENLESQVNELIGRGYQPIGGPFFIGKESYSSEDEWGHWHDDSECIYGQALVLDELYDLSDEYKRHFEKLKKMKDERGK